jgi:hypothetical protein
MPRLVRLALFALLCMASHRAEACSCARNPTAAGILGQAAAVFTGTVQQSTPLPGEHSATTFRVTESFKGPRAGNTVRVVHRSGSSASCGVKFSAGTRYTIAAQRDGDDYTTSLCSTWMFGNEAGDALIREMRALGKR